MGMEVMRKSSICNNLGKGALVSTPKFYAFQITARCVDFPPISY